MRFKLIKHNSNDQMNWGSHDDTRIFLTEGESYDGYEEVHSSYTRVMIGDRSFNSVCFENLDGDNANYFYGRNRCMTKEEQDLFEKAKLENMKFKLKPVPLEKDKKVAKGVYDVYLPELQLTPAKSIKFGNGVGELSWKTGKFIFEGDAEQSAIIFFGFVTKMLSEYGGCKCSQVS